MKRIAGFLLLLAGAVAMAAPVTELTTAAQVRALSRTDAFVQHPVRLKGCVLAFDDRQSHWVLVLADPTAAIYASGAGAFPGPALRPGTLVELRGETSQGQFAPYVLASGFSVLGSAAIPPPTPVTFDDLQSTYFDAQWIEISGIVRSVSHVTGPDAVPDKVRVDLATGGGRLPMIMREPKHGQAAGILPINSKVRVTGVAFYQFNHNRKSLGPVLDIANGENVTIIKPPPATDPLYKIQQIGMFSDNPDYGHRIRVRGTVSHHEAGAALWMEDAGQGIRVNTADAGVYAPGEVIEVAGFVAKSDDFSPVMEDVAITRLATGTPPEPARLDSPEKALAHAASLVSIQAELGEILRIPGGIRLALRCDGRNFSASLRTDASVQLPRWEEGSLVMATGISSVLQMSQRDLPGIMDPQAIQLLLRSPEDVKILRTPPWWNARRLAWLLGGVVLLLCLMATAIIWLSRKKLRRAAAARRQSEEQFAAVLSERNRIAREIHDTLAQGLGVISLRLGMLQSHLPPASKATEHLEAASDIARDCMAEARQSIWNMRSQALENHDLSEALAGVFDDLTDIDGIDTTFDATGTPVRLSPLVENNLLRMGQEAVANVIKHSGATSIRMEVHYQAHGVLIRVTDNGAGFDPDAIPSGDSHFGLLGMRERACEIGADFRIHSQPGQGTVVQIEFTAARDSLKVE